MFDKYYRPLEHVMPIRCDYDHLPYKFRQKVKSIQGDIMEIRSVSRNDYRLYLFDDACAMVDVNRNKIVWIFDYWSGSMATLNCLLSSMLRFWSYESGSLKISNHCEASDYLTLKRKYLYE